MPGALIIISTYASYPAKELRQHHPRVTLVDADNRPQEPAAEKALPFISHRS